jgi:hypothetical protein
MLSLVLVAYCPAFISTGCEQMLAVTRLCKSLTGFRKMSLSTRNNNNGNYHHCVVIFRNSKMSQAWSEFPSPSHISNTNEEGLRRSSSG